MIVLEINKPGTEEVQIFSSDKRSVTLGRHSSNDIRIEDDAVSRFHAEIEFLDGCYYIRDLDSRNGLFVNKVPVLEHRLREGDEVRIGPARLTYHAQESRSPNDSDITQVVCLFPSDGEDSPAGPTSVQEAQDMPTPGRLPEALAATLDEERVGLDPARRDALAQAALAIEVGNVIARTHDLDTLLQETLQVLARRVRFTRGVILIWEETTRSYKPRAIYQDTSADPDRTPVEAIPVSMTIVNQCLESRQGICCLDAMNDPRFSGSASIFDLHMRSVICVPLRGRQHDLGVIQVDSPNERNGGLKAWDLGAVMLVGNLLSVAVESRAALEQRNRRERRGDEARVLAAATHCLRSLFLMTSEQIHLLREAASMGDEDVVMAAAEQFAEAQQSLAQRIEGLYDYVRGRTQPFTAIRIDDILARLLDDLAPTFEEKGIAIEFQRDPDLGEGYFDSAALELLFLNLLANALEAAVESDRPMVHVVTERNADSKVCIRIHDNGPGIDAETQSRLFMPFFTTKGHGRAGLGLTYARHIIAAHDGRIECESELGLGTTFIVRLPLRDAPPPARPSSPNEVSSTASWLLEG